MRGTKSTGVDITPVVYKHDKISRADLVLEDMTREQKQQLDICKTMVLFAFSDVIAFYRTLFCITGEQLKFMWFHLHYYIIVNI